MLLSQCTLHYVQIINCKVFCSVNSQRMQILAYKAYHNKVVRTLIILLYLIYAQSLLHIFFTVYSSDLVQRFGSSKPLSRKFFFQWKVFLSMILVHSLHTAYAHHFECFCYEQHCHDVMLQHYFFGYKTQFGLFLFFPKQSKRCSSIL